MKLLKVLTILSFSLFISTAVIFSQENNTAVTGTDSIQDNGSKGNESGSEIEKSIITDTIEADKSIQSAEVKKKISANESKSESLKAGNKKITEKKIIPESANVKEEKIDSVKMDGDLLLISEGNFKYQRIPDIKLPDIKPEAADNTPKVTEEMKSVSDTPRGFLGLSKTASDNIVKGGVLLLVLFIFVIYKSRMSGPGHKSSKKRNVLNSYRK